MAMSSSSITDSPNSSESFNGLTIGHKIYFEDVGLGGGGNMPKSAAVGATGASPTKKMKGVLLQPPRCQVEGCNVDLTDVKAYYSRHKVCIMHSKSTVVIVGGVQKRFCQQCSRFHQLPEFDQEKRSCRRRLAGHNERRRKPPPMSFLTSHYGSSPAFEIFDTNNQGRGFLLDFSKNSRIPDVNQHAKSSDRRSVAGKFLIHPWTNNDESPPSGHYFHNKGGGMNIPCQEIPHGEHYTGGVFTDSSRALSLLSNELWGSAKNHSAASNLEVVNSSLINPHNSTVPDHMPAGCWGYNGNESAAITHKMFSESDLGLGQIPQHLANLYSNEHGVGQQDGRQDIRTDLSSRFYESVQQMHWSL